MNINFYVVLFYLNFACAGEVFNQGVLEKTIVNTIQDMDFKTCLICNINNGTKVMVSKEKLAEDIRCQLGIFSDNPRNSLYVALFFNEPVDKIIELLKPESAGLSSALCSTSSITFSINELLPRDLGHINCEVLDPPMFNSALEQLDPEESSIVIKMVDGKPVTCDPNDDKNIAVILTDGRVIFRAPPI